VFDIFSKEMINLLAICSLSYSDMYIIKPNTSRPANSEKYILFSNHIVPKTHKREDISRQLFTCIKNNNVNIPFYKDAYYTMLESLTEYNIIYTFNQIAQIKVALNFDKENKQENLFEKNINICKDWCKRYALD
jgi:hypothetical protein